MSHCHINISRCQLSKGTGYLIRKAYQECGIASVDNHVYDFRAERNSHRGTIVLVPRVVDPAFADPDFLAGAVLAASKRVDAQQGRTMDVALPREIPAGHELLAAAWVILPFVQAGMIAQIDAQRPLASDGEDNPHFHAVLTLRRADGRRLGPKCGEWELLFSRNRYRHVRALFASRLTAVAAHFGQAVPVDPRRKEFWSSDPVEERIPYSHWRVRRRGIIFPDIEGLLDARRHRGPPGPSPDIEAPYITISNPGFLDAEPSDLVWDRELLLRQSKALGFLVEPCPDDHYQLENPRTSRTLWLRPDLGLEADHDLTSADWNDLGSLVLACDWPALVVGGSRDAVDKLASRCGRRGVMPINHPVSPQVLDLISADAVETLMSHVAACDPANVLSRGRAGSPDCEPVVPNVP